MVDVTGDTVMDDDRTLRPLLGGSLVALVEVEKGKDSKNKPLSEDPCSRKCAGPATFIPPSHATGLPTTPCLLLADGKG